MNPWHFITLVWIQFTKLLSSFDYRTLSYRRKMCGKLLTIKNKKLKHIKPLERQWKKINSKTEENAALGRCGKWGCNCWSQIFMLICSGHPLGWAIQYPGGAPSDCSHPAGYYLPLYSKLSKLSPSVSLSP